MKKSLLLFGLVISSISLNAQSDQIWRANIYSPGFTYEKKVFDNATVTGNLGMNPAIMFSSQGNYYSIQPSFEARFNKYINFQKRLNNNLNISQNSGNYITAGIEWRKKIGMEIKTGELKNTEEDNKNLISIPFGYGIQRSISSKMYYNLILGGEYYLNKFNSSNLHPMINFKIGFTIFDSNNKKVIYK